MTTQPFTAQPIHLSRGGRWRRPSGATFAGHVVLALLSLFTVLPILWMYLASWRSPNDLFSGVLPTHPTLTNFTSALNFLPFGTLILNTVLMAIGVSLGQMLAGLFAAYAFATRSFHGKRILFLLVVATWLIPFQVTMLSNYVLLSRLGLLNTVAGVIVPQLSSAFAVLLLRQHLQGFPKELLEAARIDGQSSWSTLWKVVVPNIAPALAALEILLFVGAWNEYFWPLLVFHVPGSVLQLGIGNFLNADASNYGALMAAGGLATLPIFILYLLLQRHVVNAFVRSGLR
jgi:sn-glycerol 3-phosphate transport system permease protein